VFLDAHVDESVCVASRAERLGLLARPTVARVPARAGACAALDGNEPSAGGQRALYFSEARVEVAPVVHGRDRPRDARFTITNGERFSRAAAIGNAACVPQRQQARTPQHHGRRIHADRRHTEPRGSAHGCTWTTSDVEDDVAARERGQLDREAGVAVTPDHHAQRGNDPDDPGERRVLGVVVGNRFCVRHDQTLTVELGFKSSGVVTERLLAIGEVAARAKLSTSAIRYYERR
jgi:hypothetical protein